MLKSISQTHRKFYGVIVVSWGGDYSDDIILLSFFSFFSLTKGKNLKASFFGKIQLHVGYTNPCPSHHHNFEFVDFMFHFNIPLVIFAQVKNSLRYKRSCLRLVKKLTGKFMRVNELYFLIEYKILEGFV